MCSDCRDGGGWITRHRGVSWIPPGHRRKRSICHRHPGSPLECCQCVPASGCSMDGLARRGWSSIGIASVPCSHPGSQPSLEVDDRPKIVDLSVVPAPAGNLRSESVDAGRIEYTLLVQCRGASHFTPGPGEISAQAAAIVPGAVDFALRLEPQTREAPGRRFSNQPSGSSAPSRSQAPPSWSSP